MENEVFMSSMVGATGSLTPLKKTGYQQVSTLSPDKASLFGQGAQGLQQGFPQILQKLMQMAQGGDEATWSKLEAPAMRQFGALQGNIASRFSGMGSGGRRSSGFQHAVGGAGADLAERLQANRLGLQNQATESLMGLYKSLMGTEDTALVPKAKKWWEELLPAVTQGASQALTSYGLSFIP